VPDLFLYTDFRKFLSDYYNEQKEANPHFSYKMLACKVGITNKGFLYNIMKGKKPLSAQIIFKLTTALKLECTEQKYFETLVQFNQSKEKCERDRHFQELERIRNEEPRTFCAHQLEHEQFGIYSNWYHCVIRSLLDMYKFNGDFSWLAQKVYPPISIKQAEQSVHYLEKLGLVIKNGDGFFEVTNKTITSGIEKKNAIRNFHYETLDLARKSLSEVPVDKRNISGLTLGISEPMYLRMCKEVQLFQERLLALAEQDDGANRVYQMNFHFFPMSGNGD
jgi:uncharacterized protein (TIGR02147 family)